MFLKSFYCCHKKYLPFEFACEDLATIFHLACSSSDFKLLELLRQLSPEGIHWQDAHGMSPLFYCIKSNHFEMTKHLLDLQVDVDHTDGRGSTPLYLSVLYAKFQIFKLLADRTSKINHQNIYGRTALMKAIYLCDQQKTTYL